MARPGIEFKAVERVARQLLSQGQHPSVQKVRDVLGTGSNTTIAKHLKTWQKAFSQSISPTLPESVPDDLMIPLDDFWNTAVARAESNYQKLKAELEDKVVTAELKQATAESLHDEKANEIVELQKTLTVTQKELTDTEQQLNTVQGKFSALSGELNHAQNEVNETHLLLKNQSLLFERQSEKSNELQQQSLEYERVRSNEAENRLLNEIDLLRQEVKSMKAMAQSQQNEYQTLKDNKHQHELILVQEITDLKNNNQQLITNQKQYSQSNEQLKHQLVTHQKQVTQCLETIESLRQSLDESKSNEIALVNIKVQLKETIARLQLKRGKGDEHKIKN